MSTEDKIAELMRAVDDFRKQPAYDGEGWTNPCLAPARAEVERLARDLAGPTQEDLRRLVAEVWCYVGFDPSVPEHVADALITKALGKEKA